MTRTRKLPALVGAALLLAAADAGAQQGCQFIEGSGNLQRMDTGSGPITYVSTPNLSCRDGVRIRADSAVAFEASNYVQLIGNVRFEDPERRLTAQNAEYFTTVGRLQAHNGAELVQKTDSSRVRGAEMVYNRADENRPRAQLDVYGDRATARLHVRRDSTAPQPDSARAPYDVEADRILIETDTYFRARGDVKIDRRELHAQGDSVEYDQVAGTMTLMSRARMTIEGRELTAERITVDLPNDEVREIVARRNAVVAAEDIRLRAPLVRVFFEAGAMQRLVAVPLGSVVAGPSGAAAAAEPTGALPAPQPEPSEEDRARPVALAEDFTIVADSIDVLAPAEVLDEIHAVGASRAESSARDSLNTPDTPPLARTDWMEGDTIVATFVRADSADGVRAAPDSAGAEYRIERLSAHGKARSLYRMEPGDSARARGERTPAIHYVAASSIVLEWSEGEIRAMHVRGQTEGVHAEPAGVAPDSAATADSVRASGGSALGVAPVPTVGNAVAGAGSGGTTGALPSARPAARRRSRRRAG